LTRSLCPRISWACCARGPRLVLASHKIAPLGTEHRTGMSWGENTGAPALRAPYGNYAWGFLVERMERRLYRYPKITQLHMSGTECRIESLDPGSRGSGCVRGFFAQAGFRSMVARGHR